METTQHYLGENPIWIQTLLLKDSCFIYIGSEQCNFDHLSMGITQPNTGEIVVANILNTEQTSLTEKLCRRTGKVITMSLNLENVDPMSLQELENIIIGKVGIRLVLAEEHHEKMISIQNVVEFSLALLEVCGKRPQIVTSFSHSSYQTILTIKDFRTDAHADTSYSSMETCCLKALNELGLEPVVTKWNERWNPPPPPEVTPDDIYIQELEPLRFRTADFKDESGYINHSAVGTQDQTTEVTAEVTNRVNKEIKVLSKNLPCYIAGSIFVVMDENRMDLMKSLISGPVDSPYAHGLFLFDINLPEDYPGQPPNMKLKTTGSGAARFNPNLYADGYICLSILGTWEGSPEEMWIPSQSNILQVLLSIQSLVMDEYVIQKEPGYDYLEKNALENVTYCNIVRYNNIKYAMIDMIRNPPPEFAEVIKSHFRIKKSEILKTMEEWLSDAPGFKYNADQRPDPAPESINDVDFISNDADVPELHMYESYDSYLYDNLVEDHNWQTLHIFREQGYETALTEVVNELKLELERLE